MCPIVLDAKTGRMLTEKLTERAEYAKHKSLSGDRKRLKFALEPDPAFTLKEIHFLKPAEKMNATHVCVIPIELFALVETTILNNFSLIKSLFQARLIAS